MTKVNTHTHTQLSGDTGQNREQGLQNNVLLRDGHTSFGTYGDTE